MVMPSMVFGDVGIFGIIPYLLILSVCVVPIAFLQSFLGQFSGTGFISVFRVSPLFKGIGYVSLLVNILVLCYYSVLSAIPLFYFFHSMRPTVPWSCEGSESWLNLTEFETSFCDRNSSQSIRIVLPSVQFFIDHLNIATRFSTVYDHSFSVELTICCWIVWGVVAYVVLKSTESIGRIVRFSFLTVVTILIICLIRFLFLPGAMIGLLDFLWPSHHRIFTDSWLFVPTLALSALGPGWGSVLTMASFNNFKTNIFSYSWMLCFTHLGLMIGIALLSVFMQNFMEVIYPEYFYKSIFYHNQWLEFLSIPTGLEFVAWSRFWSLLFFSMWILGSLNILIIQMLSLVTSILDEFEGLREIRNKVIIVAVGFFATTSILFCTNLGFYLFGLLSGYAVATEAILNLLLLLVVLWVYGRERFQRDLKFMTSRTYSTWMVNIVRFVAPLFLLVGLLIALFVSLESDSLAGPSSLVAFAFGTLLFLFSWCLIPGYCIVRIKRTTGIIGIRLRRCVRPADWYPADPVYKQRYEETFSTTDISHNLTTEIVENL